MFTNFKYLYRAYFLNFPWSIKQIQHIILIVSRI